MPFFSEMPCLSELKKHLLSLFRPTAKSIFNIYEPVGTKYLFKLRLGFSKLRSHRKFHNFLDTPTDHCLCKTGVKDTRHFLFHCLFYARHRATLASSVINVLEQTNLNHLADSEPLYVYPTPTPPTFFIPYPTETHVYSARVSVKCLFLFCAHVNVL